jgi:hypothetical protein
MSNQKCSSCGADKQPAAMISMSEANWERNEFRHATEKKTLFLIALTATILFILSNAAWLVYHTAFASRCSANHSQIDTYEVASNETQTEEAF